jgi:hypothetical protein
LLVVGGSGDSAAGHSRGQGGLGKKSGPVAVIWVTVEARSMLADPIDLRHNVEVELGTHTRGDRGKAVWGRFPHSPERGRRREGKRRWCASRRSGASGGDGCGKRAFVGPIYRLARSVRRGDIFPRVHLDSRCTKPLLSRAQVQIQGGCAQCDLILSWPKNSKLGYGGGNGRLSRCGRVVLVQYGGGEVATKNAEGIRKV